MNYEMNSVILMNNKFERIDYDLSNINASCKDEVTKVAYEKAISINESIFDGLMEITPEEEGIYALYDEGNYAVARVFFHRPIPEKPEEEMSFRDEMDYVYKVTKLLRDDGQVSDRFVSAMENILLTAFDSSQ